MLLITAGDQVPVTPLLEVAGSVGATDPSQKAGMAVKVGVTFGVTVTSSVDVVAQRPAVGVKV